MAPRAARAQVVGGTVDASLRAERRKNMARYDVFMSQTVHDRELVYGVYAITAEDLGLTVF